MKIQANPGIQPPAVAGVFYPAEPENLLQSVDQMLLDAEAEGGDEILPIWVKAVIAPHAGYIYSGSVAAAAYARIKHRADEIRRVVVFAPAHRLPFSGMAIASADRFATPLGEIPVDSATRQRVLDSDCPVQILDEAYEEEHALEVQLPFLQRMLSDFVLLPIVVGDTDPEEVKQLMDIVWGGPETLIVVSSDLSHFYDYDTAERMDKLTSSAIEALDPTGIGYENACGRTPINGLLMAARDRSLQVITVSRCNSADTAGDRASVVGYGAYVFS